MTMLRDHEGKGTHLETLGMNEKIVFEKVDRFSFEQQIFDAWNVTKDINTLLEGVVEKDLTKDQIANALLGMHQIYELKFGKLFDMFEELVRNKEL